mmetsp:Transcript_8847/g.13202  ORF Transcript_8847/g.13202 Transcript_8847/m.13202 type:complete len:156 (-) Transcript_8847:109-576(-)
MIARHLKIIFRHNRNAMSLVRRPFSADAQDKVGNTPGGQAVKQVTKSLMEASVTDIHHKANLALAVATPIAFVLSPSVINMPVDMALTVLIPVHSHVCMNLVAEDYVPPGTARSSAKIGIALVSLLTAFGLMKVTMCGPGITESIKSMWRKPKTE